MGVGKSTVSEIVANKLEYSVFLDGDWCWKRTLGLFQSIPAERVADQIIQMIGV